MDGGGISSTQNESKIILEAIQIILKQRNRNLSFLDKNDNLI